MRLSRWTRKNGLHRAPPILLRLFNADCLLNSNDSRSRRTRSDRAERKREKRVALRNETNSHRESSSPSFSSSRRPLNSFLCVFIIIRHSFPSPNGIYRRDRISGWRRLHARLESLIALLVLVLVWSRLQYDATSSTIGDYNRTPVWCDFNDSKRIICLVFVRLDAGCRSLSVSLPLVRFFDFFLFSVSNTVMRGETREKKGNGERVWENVTTRLPRAPCREREREEAVTSARRATD